MLKNHERPFPPCKVYFRPNGLAAGLLAAVCAAGLAACVTPFTLEQTVLSYDRSFADTLSRQLLLNIARARHHDPIHFTGISNIAATYNFTVSAGASPALTGASGSTMVPIFGIGAAENPTISIVPIEGEEFTKRLLTPFAADKVILLLRQNYDIDLLLRLMVGELRLPKAGKEIALHNDPSDPEGYRQYRRVVLHLSSIQDRNSLYVEPLVYRRDWTLPAAAMTADGLASLERNEITVTFDEAKGHYRLSTRVMGGVAITNYDPKLFSDEEKFRMSEDARKGPPNEIAVDIRAGFPGGEFPITGKLRLRSFLSILNFLGASITEEPEFPVTKDPRTPVVTENPDRTIAILEAAIKPEAPNWTVEYRDYWYAVAPDASGRWNASGFQLLHQVFQMAVSELPRPMTPGITIAK